MRCAMCNRRIKGATFTIGRMSYGPTCAKRLGYFKNRKAKFVPPVVQDEQMDLFGGVA